MSFLVRPPMHQPRSGPESIDQLLTRFFRAEMPDPWPVCPDTEEPARILVPEEPATQPRASWLELSQRFASRLALALSLAILLCGAWLLSGSFTGPVSPSQPTAPGVAIHQFEALPATAERGRFKVTENFVQPKDGATKLNIDIIEIAPPSPR